MKQGKLMMAGVCLLVFGLWGSLAHAHRVSVFCWVEGNQLHTQSSFQPGGPVKGGQVQLVVPATGEVLATGTTDLKGQYTFHIPDRAREQQLDLQVLLGAGAGHEGRWDVPAADYVDGLDAGAQALAVNTRGNGTRGPAQTVQGMQGISPETLQRILDRELDRKLAPIKRHLARMQEDRFSVREIVGGLGYFFGMLGVALYCRSRQRDKDGRCSSPSVSRPGGKDPS